MKADVEECLRALSLEEIGIFYLHQVQSLDDLKGRQGALDCLIEFKKRGIVQAIGASLHAIAGMQAVNNEPAIDVVFPVLNMHGLGIIDGDLEDMLKVLEESKAKGKFVYAMKPLGGGHLYKEVEEAFKFLRELPTCDAIACGMKDEAEVEMNVSIFNNLRVSEEVKQRVHTVGRGGWLSMTAALPAGCAWRSATRAPSAWARKKPLLTTQNIFSVVTARRYALNT